MMKLFLNTILVGLGLTLLTATPAFAETKIATVSLQKLFDNYWKTKQAESALQDQQAEMKKSESEMTDNWKKTNTDYQKLRDSAADQAVSAEERDKRKKDAEDKLKELKDIELSIQQFQRQASTTLSEKKARLTKNIIEEIKLGVAGKAKSGGYTIVADADALLFADPATDITDSVLSQLNAGAPATAAKPDVKKEAK